MHKAFSLLALSAIGLTSAVSAAKNYQGACAPEPAAPCNQEDCCRVYCLGPSNYAGNPPVKPVTCNGDFGIELSAFYWNAHQDGMEYAIDSHVRNPQTLAATTDTQVLNNLINAEYHTPDFDWNWGFKAGVYYNSPCDGWDIGVLWTWYKGSASSHLEAEQDDNHTLLPLWSAFAPGVGGVLWATDIVTDWSLKLNLVDIELGRQFWTSKFLSIRPFVGVRVAYIGQDYDIQNKGGAFSANGLQPSFNDYVDLDNDFKGAGLRAGLDSEWNFGCGWALYGTFAASLVYGKFSIDHDEWVRAADGGTNFAKTRVLETSESFRVSRAMLDMALGIQYSTLFCNCDYGLTIQLGWEQHLFFHQNQMWRVVRIGDNDQDVTSGTYPNPTGENVFHQRRGNLDTQGVTLTFKFEF